VVRDARDGDRIVSARLRIGRIGAALAVLVFTLLASAATTRPAGRPALHSMPGSLVDSCTDVMNDLYGIEFRHGEMWVLGYEGTLTRVDDQCRPVQILSINGFLGEATGMGYDSKRDLFVVTDGSILTRKILCVSPEDGSVVRALPLPTGVIFEDMVLTGIILGAAYDSTRDVYWMVNSDSLYAVHPVTGDRVATYPLPFRSFSAGCAYDAANDAIYYTNRLQFPFCIYISAKDASLLGQFDLPYGALFDNWHDNAFAPDGTLWIQHGIRGKSYAIERSVTAVRHATWSQLKLRFR
jgi:hypothetical protein